MAFWYIGSTKYAAVTAFQPSTTYSIGQILRPPAATAGNERVFVVTLAGTTASSIGSSFATTKGGQWGRGTMSSIEATGQPALNGDVLNTPPWTAGVKRKLGDVIKNVAGGATTYFICTASAPSGTTEPTWNKTPGATTSDNFANWLCLGPIGNFTAAWGAPHARLDNVDTYNWGEQGDTYFISNHHAQTSSSASNFLDVGAAAPSSSYLCVEDSVVPPTTLATTATITITSGTATLQPVTAYIYGLNWYAASGTGVSHIVIACRGGHFENCSFNLNNTNAGSRIRIGGSGGSNISSFGNCAFTFGAAGQTIFPAAGNWEANSRFVGGSVAATGVAPTVLFDTENATYRNAFHIAMRDVDLSAITGTIMLTGLPSNGYNSSLDMHNCKLGAGVTIASGTMPNLLDSITRVFDCDSAATNYRLYTRNYMGSAQSNIAVTRTGGAAGSGTPLSWKLDSSANAAQSYPLEAQEIAIWNELVGTSITATVEIAGAAALNTTDIWVEFDYPGSSGSPLGNRASTRGAYLSGITIPASSASWTGSPASTQKLSASFTPQMPGVIKARVYLAKPNTSVYVDPYIGLDNGVANRRQYLLPGLGNMNETAQGEVSCGFVG